MKFLALITTAILILGFTSNAKTNMPENGVPLFDKGIVKGVVIDSTAGTPLQFANVVLQRAKDSSFVTGTASGVNGEFIFSNIIEGSYLLKINSLGYTNRYVANLKIHRDMSEYNLGTLKLTKNTIQLNEAVVSGERPDEELRLDKKIINVTQNTNAAGGTALDVLENQPSIRVDQDGTVYLRGSSSFTILINGKPSVLQGSDALKQISASTIDNIELITNPSSRYDAEGTSGIININLKKQTEYSLSGIANINSGTRDKYNSDFSFNYNMNGLNLTGGLDYRNNTNLVTQDVTRTSYLPIGTIDNASLLNIRVRQQQYTLRGGMDYTIDPLNSVSLSLSGGKYDISRSLNTRIRNISSAGTTYNNNTGSMDIPVKFFSATVNYNHKFIPTVNDLSFEAYFSNANMPSDQLTYQYNADADYNITAAAPILTDFYNDASKKEGRIKLDYKHVISPSSTFEMGVQPNFNIREFDIVNNIYDFTAGRYVADSSMTNDFRYRNNVYAGYVSYSNEFAEFQFQAGLRGEYTDRLLSQRTIGGDFSFRKMDYFPSLNISRKIEDHQLQFSYSRRVQRPNENLLNPFPHYTDANFTSAGNPYLLPAYINSFELNYQKVFGKTFVSVQTFYRNTNNDIQQSFRTENSGRMYSTFDNFAKTSNYGAEISTSVTLADFLKIDPALNLSGNTLKGVFVSRNVDESYFNWNGRMNLTATITPDTRFMVSGNYVSKYIDAQFDIKPFFFLSASIKQDFFEKRLSLTLQARNMLKTQNMDIRMPGVNYDGRVVVSQERPIVMLMLSYNFNNFKRTAKPADVIEVPTGI